MKAVIYLSFIFSFLIFPPRFAHSQSNYYPYQKNKTLYSHIINYFHSLETERSSSPRGKERIFIFLIDLVFSFVTLWMVLVLVAGIKKFNIKQYLWFWFAFNLSCLIFFIFYGFAWDTLYYLMIRLRPDLKSIVLDNFYLFSIVFPSGLYIWLLARTFSLNFFGACGIFVFSHLLYFLFSMLIITYVPSSYFPFGEFLGFKAIIKSYLECVDIISSNRYFSYFLYYLKPFHI